MDVTVRAGGGGWGVNHLREPPKQFHHACVLGGGDEWMWEGG